MNQQPDGGRWELKYLLPLSKREPLLALAADYTLPDPHGVPFPEFGTRGYDVHSLYFDTPSLDDYTERLEERSVRVRMRIRTYGKPGDGAPVFLEDKRKLDKWVIKQRAYLTDAETWLATPHPKPWVYWAERVTGKGQFAAQHFLRRVEGEGRVPVSIVHYRRECFVGRDRSDRELRVTLDHHLNSTTSPTSADLYLPPDKDLLPPGYFVLELKFNQSEPVWMRRLISALNLHCESISKFALSVAHGLRADHPKEVRLVTPRSLLRATENV